MIAAGPLRFATAAMGTRFELVLGGDRPERWQGGCEEALAVVEECHRRLSRFAADSLVSHINRTAWQRPVRLDRDTFALFRDALEVERSSGGAFDVTVGPAMERSTTNADVRAIVLDAADHTIRLRDADVRIDLGAIAKGHALDLAGRLLIEYGVDCALLHGGTSSVLAIGAPPGSDGWGIALEGFAERVVLRDSALAVSAATGHATGAGVARTSHIVDPRTGRAIPLSRRAAIVGPSARLCDAWATALAVMGERPSVLGPEWTTCFEQ